jgi:hypothetical protein
MYQWREAIGPNALQNPLVQEILSSSSRGVWTTHGILVHMYSILKFNMAVLPSLRTTRRQI